MSKINFDNKAENVDINYPKEDKKTPIRDLNGVKLI